MSLTSLIDVIFLLLLFFMLSSTFSRFAEVELTAAAAAQAESSDRPPMFLRLTPDAVSLNGEETALDGLAAALADEAGDGEAARSVLVSLGERVSAQRLTDLLGVLRTIPGIAPTVLRAS